MNKLIKLIQEELDILDYMLLDTELDGDDTEHLKGQIESLNKVLEWIKGIL